MRTDISGQRKCNKSALQWSLLSKKQAADTRVLVQIDWDRYLVLRDDQPNQTAEILLMVNLD